MTLIERLEHGETYTDAVDDAIYEIQRLRGVVESHKTERATLRRALEKACEYVADAGGSCPFDVHGWERIENCANVCLIVGAESRGKCWLHLFMEEE